MPNQRSTTVSLKNLTLFIHYVLLLVYVMTLSTVFHERNVCSPAQTSHRFMKNTYKIFRTLYHEGPNCR